MKKPTVLSLLVSIRMDSFIILLNILLMAFIFPVTGPQHILSITIIFSWTFSCYLWLCSIMKLFCSNQTRYWNDVFLFIHLIHVLFYLIGKMNPDLTIQNMNIQKRNKVIDNASTYFKRIASLNKSLHFYTSKLSTCFVYSCFITALQIIEILGKSTIVVIMPLWSVMESWMKRIQDLLILSKYNFYISVSYCVLRKRIIYHAC